MISGLGLGENSQAALITRALAEMTRLGLKLGAHQETFAGLSGIGDLVATCTSPLSRNHTAGTLLAQGKAAKDIEQGTHMVIEGMSTTKTVYAFLTDLVSKCLLSINFMKFCTIIRKSLLRPMILCHDRGRKSGTNY